MALDKRLANHTATGWLLSRALRATPSYRHQHVAIGAVEDLANRSAVAAQQLNRLGRDLIECVAWQRQQRLHLGHLTETAEDIETLRLRVGRQSVGNMPPMCAIRQNITLETLGVGLSTRQTEQQPRPTYHALVGREHTLKQIAAS